MDESPSELKEQEKRVHWTIVICVSTKAKLSDRKSVSGGLVLQWEQKLVTFGG